jgi:hypothetical protein
MNGKVHSVSILRSSARRGSELTGLYAQYLAYPLRPTPTQSARPGRHQA